jgi:hypothetical protein
VELTSGLFLDIDMADIDGSVFATCVRLWNVGDYFRVPARMKDALNAPENYCDEKILLLCKTLYMTPTQQVQGQHTKLDEELVTNLLRGIKVAYRGDPNSTPFKNMLVSFYYAGRFNLLNGLRFLELIGEVHEFAVDFLKILESGDGFK